MSTEQTVMSGEQRTPSLAGMTSWTAGLRLPDDGDIEAQPGKYIVKIMFDDPDQAKAWASYLIAHDPVWGGCADEK